MQATIKKNSIPQEQILNLQEIKLTKMPDDKVEKNLIKGD